MDKKTSEIIVIAFGIGLILGLILFILVNLLTSKPTDEFLNKKTFDLYMEYSTEIDNIEMDVIIEGEGEIQIHNSILTIHEYYCTDTRPISLTE